MSRPYVSPHLGKLRLAHDLDERGAVRKIRTALEGMIPGGATDADAQSVLDALGIAFDASPEDCVKAYMEDSRKAEEAGVVTLAELATAAGVLYGGLAMDVQKSRAQIVKMLMAREPDWTTDDEVAKDLDDWLSERVTVKAAWDALVEELPAEDRDDDLEVQGAVLRDLIKQGLRVEELRETINTFWETDG